ncbi:MAG: hypothetical protein DWQ05_20805 [Calditrichaeota bacterium]|nr:MAG: hypothetical protein DWQ05_20805 [Calditrichota bacterium]
MNSKTKLKQEIDKLPDDLIEEIYQYLKLIKSKKPNKALLKTYHLEGKFDNLNIRAEAYE